MITVFTPTYNRSFTLGKLYRSLIRQTYQEFEWLIVDDGSTDDTETLLESFLEEKKITLRWIKTKNGGKHRAINLAVREAKGGLFFIVDSDDYLYDNALEQINFYASPIMHDDVFAGVCGLKTYFNGNNVGGEKYFEILNCSALDFRFKHKVKGDMAEVFKTAVLREYRFPEIENEKFCPEAFVWNQIALKYQFRYFNAKIYYCDYLPDGLTAKIIRLRMESPITSQLYYSDLFGMK
ncbi:MAG: glycosyltransferase family A protein, partial [Eubacteriales bacterium]